MAKRAGRLTGGADATELVGMRRPPLIRSLSCLYICRLFLSYLYFPLLCANKSLRALPFFCCPIRNALCTYAVCSSGQTTGLLDLCGQTPAVKGACAVNSVLEHPSVMPALDCMPPCNSMCWRVWTGARAAVREAGIRPSPHTGLGPQTSHLASCF